MGEAKRRKQSDPDYGKEASLPEFVFKSWQEGSTISFLSKADSRNFGLIDSNILISPLPCPKWDYFSESVLRGIRDKVFLRYKEFGRGLITVVSVDNLLSKPQRVSTDTIWLDWDYWNLVEIKNLLFKRPEFSDVPNIKQFTEWVINNYDPEKEFICVPVEIPLSIVGCEEVRAKGHFFKVPLIE